VRGIYPPVLADRGLGDAIRALALDTPLPTVLDIDLPEQVDLPVASAIYFSVAEALANVTKHAGARSVRIVLSHAAGMLRAEVTDDGAGGADPACGTGLAGVERRLATFDGILAVSSPPGGPTIVVIEVVQKLMTSRSRTEPVTRLTPREREVLSLMAEGRSNAAIAQRLFITEKAVSKHAAGIFGKLDLVPSDDDNRRVLAVLAYLDS
jgi:DNA-binding NarL/FixJ family response regulator